ncbi:cytochrome c biogenesis protein ResB [Actinocorallia sp. A-T 12471]|uniref:cytochrome c biogenesis protein ResB n=1 Tax=Actinocorallia sp. A-T 12471 TaxID=3089813 RepID=UPI0029CD876E|nr:cytochrome c biogenesis protein ResB [Actinocorallia sp. A-T 12471]MDX6741761.1 cytochrome c biogenesis protein ResB [Actinocorallia sp. A-T 12471]
MGLTGWLRWGWRQLTSMRTALVLLFLVALASVPGSIFPQRGMSPEKVQEYFTNNPDLAVWLDRLSLFDVFAAPWFAAIYLLLFTSLAGCVVPRAWQLFQHVRARPPKAPKRFGRLPQHAEFTSEAAPSEVVEAARTALRGRRFRTVVDSGAGGESVASEKGYLGEAGNLLFHLALLALLFAVGLGALFGYRGNLLLTEGKGFSNSLAFYDEYQPGHFVDPEDLAPFQLTLDDFEASFISSGPQTGQPKGFSAKVTYQEEPGGEGKKYDIRVNHPLQVDGAKVYLLGHGYAPTFKITDSEGNVAFDDAVQFLPRETGNLTSEGVLKAPDAKPQLAFQMMFWPTAGASGDGTAIVSTFPGPLNPTVAVMAAFKGDLNMDGGAPQSVFEIDSTKLEMVKLAEDAKVLKLGDKLELPDGAGTLEFTGFKEYGAITVTYDPGRVPALVAGALAILGLVGSFMIRRRRVWVRASVGKDGRTLVEVGGLTLGAATAEFDEIVRELRPDDDGRDTRPQDSEPVATGPIKE